MNLNDMLVEDQRGQDVPADDALRTVAHYAQMLSDLEAEVALLEQDLGSAKEDLQHVKTKLLPEAMAATGMTAVKLASGVEVEVKQELYASIPAATREEACAWLRTHEHGSIVKREYKVVLRGADEGYADACTAVQDFATQHGLTLTSKEDVHPQTLAAFVKELRSEGDDVPTDLFKIYVEDVAKIKRPRQTRTTPRARRT